MANAYVYSNTAVQTTLDGNINNSQTTLDVASASGFPGTFPYVLAVDLGAPGEELVKVTGAAAETLTVVRGHSGTSAANHSTGAVIAHVWHAGDATDFRTHEAGTTGVHGLSGAPVGTSDVQTLSGKTLTSPTINAGALSGTFTGSPTLSGNPVFSGTPAFAGATFSGAVTHNGATALAAGGSLAGTFTGSPTLSGVPVFSGGPTFSRGAAGDTAMRAQVTGDPNSRWYITAAGAMNWGPGSATQDVTLYREAADILTTDDAFRSSRAATTDTAFSAKVAAEGTSRLTVRADGRMDWGSGSGAGDTNLYRSAANTLTTDDAFEALVTTTSSGLTAGTGYGSATLAARRTCGVVSFHATVTRTGADINADIAGNITDSLCATLPSGWRPAHVVIAAFSVSGIAHGDATIDTDGTITLKSLSSQNAAINNGQTVSVSGCWVA